MQEILLLAEGLQPGETLRTVCPVCGGGTSKERSFNLSKTDTGAVWVCHRASCGTKGGTGVSNVIHITKPEPPKDNPYTGALEPLSEEWKNYLKLKIGWDDWHFEQSGAMFAPEEDRVAYPIFNRSGFRVGYILRSYFPVKRKALTYLDRWTESRLSHYPTGGTQVCVVVEDIPSAVRASRYGSAVALNGTGMSLSTLEELMPYKRLVLALDADATEKAIRYKREFEVMIENGITVLVLERDLKDEKEERLCKLLSEYFDHEPVVNDMAVVVGV